ncbi:hypothetical protein J1N35_022487 [Gossypium stocksii]|uniref:Uncharacterized protein n=1 Tax=Gossypium stocksii TaxID=47602 RepID=A0A9D3VHA3_9ROSI|nr:hypothetical protein J1N35_022487 [Gossypium stocksii]
MKIGSGVQTAIRDYQGFVGIKNMISDMNLKGKAHGHGTFRKELKHCDYLMGFPTCLKLIMVKPYIT